MTEEDVLLLTSHTATSRLSPSHTPVSHVRPAPAQ